MTATMEAMGINRLSIPERLSLVNEIWDSIASDVQREPLSSEMKRELDRRIANYELNPDSAVSWEQVEAEALARLHR